MTRTFLASFRLFLLLFCMVSVEAHIGSPYVSYEGEAGPYRLRVSIQPPEVVPGRAQINIRVHNGPVTRVTALPVRWDAGRKGAPPPDVALPVAGETNLYNTELWLMDFGAYSVFVDVEGASGSGTAIVPLNSVATERLEMPRWMGAVFLAAGLLLVVLLVFIVGAAVRESVVPPAAKVEPARIRRGRVGMAAAFVLIGAILWRGSAWWNEVDADFRNNRLFKPVEVATELRQADGRPVIALAADPTEREWRDHTPLVADHGKLMHLFAIREDMDAFAHLHPTRTGDDYRFETVLPPLPPGAYLLYGDVTHESGLARTLVSSIQIPASAMSPASLDPDDSWWIAAGQGGEEALSHGVAIRMLSPEQIVAGVEVSLRFDAVAADDKPAPLEPYMGMWSHAVLRARNGSVFIHLHPSGTISMTAQELFARREKGEDLRKPIDVMCGRPERELVFPYAFPKPGEYRIWVQVKAAGNVVTAPFDLQVLPRGT